MQLFRCKEGDNGRSRRTTLRNGQRNLSQRSKRWSMTVKGGEDWWVAAKKVPSATPPGILLLLLLILCRAASSAALSHTGGFRVGGGVHDSYTFQCGLVGYFTSPGIDIR